MRNTFLLTVILLAFAFNVNAQRYSINKYKFDTHQYIPEYGDVNNPAVSGICSFFVPGLGQILCGETGRGIAFLGGYVGCAALFEAGAINITSNLSYYDNSGYPRTSNSGVGIMLLGLGGMAVIEVWSIFDAIQVAKINNMYYRSLRKTSSLKLEMSPYVDHISITNQVSNPIGMTMRVKF
jgi:TM2 domain-containing membrane protein YozV